MIVSTRCQHCNGAIDFDAGDDGSLLPCPHCGKQTRLQIARPAPKIQPPKSETISLEKRERVPVGVTLLIIATAVLFVIGLVLVFAGCGGELSESLSAEGSAVRQTV